MILPREKVFWFYAWLNFFFNANFFYVTNSLIYNRKSECLLNLSSFSEAWIFSFWYYMIFDVSFKFISLFLSSYWSILNMVRYSISEIMFSFW
jgi:hypothetical protein